MIQLETCVRNIVRDEVPFNHLFDSHMVIQRMLQQYPDEYISNVGTYTTILQYHGRIAQEIGKLEGTLIERMGRSYSQNTKNNFSKRLKPEEK